MAWIESVRRPATRRKRIEETVEMAKRNVRPKDYLTKKKAQPE